MPFNAIMTCLTRFGARPSASQLVACFELTFQSNCHQELLRSQFYITSSEKPKVTIDADNPLDGLLTATIALELEDFAADNNPFDDIQVHHGKLF